MVSSLLCCQTVEFIFPRDVDKSLKKASGLLARAGRAVLSEVMVGSCRLSGESSIQKFIKVVEIVRYLVK